MGRLFLKVRARVLTFEQEHRDLLQRLHKNHHRTKRIVHKKLHRNVDYISAAGQLSFYCMSNPPNERELTKKFTLMQYFNKYLNGNVKEETLEHGLGMLCYVKKWAKSDSGIIFRLSNKVIQTNFVDKSQIVIYCQKNVGVFSGLNLGN